MHGRLRTTARPEDARAMPPLLVAGGAARDALSELRPTAAVAAPGADAVDRRRRRHGSGFRGGVDVAGGSQRRSDDRSAAGRRSFASAKTVSAVWRRFESTR